MKFSFRNIKTKSQGVSLVVALGVSLFLSGMTLSILQSVEKSLEQSQNLERSNQVFLAAESGLEAAFFHHNSRGQGVDFGLIGDVTDSSQQIFHGEVGAEVSWTIEGRKDSIVGVLHEGEKVSIPFFWDDSENAAIDSAEGFATNGFTLTFSQDRFNEDGSPSGEELIPNGFNFGVTEDLPLIAWSLSRVHNTKGIQSLISITDPASPQEPCAGNTSFLCRDNALPTSTISSSGGTDLPGNVVPVGNPPESDTSISTFLSNSDASNYRFSFQPLLSFTDDLENTIEGIPFKLEPTASIKIPAQSYTATAKVDVADFSKTISVTVPEKQSIGAFDYLVFD